MCTMNIWLFNENLELTIAISAKSQYNKSRFREISIMERYSV